MIKLFLNSKLDLIRTVKFVKQLFIIQIQKDRKVLLWTQVKSRMEACYSELISFALMFTLLANMKKTKYFDFCSPLRKPKLQIRDNISICD